jgi:hypothetical protein
LDLAMRSSLLPRLVPLATLIVACCATLVAIAVWWIVPSNEDCSLPAGAAQLAPAAQADIARHVLACRDLEHGRITRDEYRHLIGAELPSVPASVPPPIVWASSVLGVSSEYSAGSWSAHQVLGPPDVYPGSGDNPHAWASAEADAQAEYIEVGFAQPVAMRELQIYETFNPGAIESIEMISVSGRRTTYTAFATRGGGSAARITGVQLQCGEAIAAVRVNLLSSRVPGWNELDAIGGVPCTQP